MVTECPLLFQFIFQNKLNELKEYLSQHSIENNQNNTLTDEITQRMDLINCHYRGQTPLTLAISLGHKDIVQLLLENGASTLLKNSQGWNPIQEATSLGQRPILHLLYSHQRHELSKWFEEKGQTLLKKVSELTGNFKLKISWKLESMIPYLTRLCPWVSYRKEIFFIVLEKFHRNF
jgi:ankyrin repeat protein